MSLYFRCPICQGFLHFSFIDDSEAHYTVYRCARCPASDERLFVLFSQRLVEIRVVRRSGGEKKPPLFYAVPLNDDEMKKVRAAEAERRRFAELHNVINTARFFAELEEFNMRRRAFEALMTADPAELGAAIVANIAAELVSSE